MICDDTITNLVVPHDGDGSTITTTITTPAATTTTTTKQPDSSTGSGSTGSSGPTTGSDPNSRSGGGGSGSNSEEDNHNTLAFNDMFNDILKSNIMNDSIINNAATEAATTTTKNNNKTQNESDIENYWNLGPDTSTKLTDHDATLNFFSSDDNENEFSSLFNANVFDNILDITSDTNTHQSSNNMIVDDFSTLNNNNNNNNNNNVINDNYGKCRSPSKIDNVPLIYNRHSYHPYHHHPHAQHPYHHPYHHPHPHSLHPYHHYQQYVGEEYNNPQFPNNNINNAHNPYHNYGGGQHHHSHHHSHQQQQQQKNNNNNDDLLNHHNMFFNQNFSSVLNFHPFDSTDHDSVVPSISGRASPSPDDDHHHIVNNNNNNNNSDNNNNNKKNNTNNNNNVNNNNNNNTSTTNISKRLLGATTYEKRKNNNENNKNNNENNNNNNNNYNKLTTTTTTTTGKTATATKKEKKIRQTKTTPKKDKDKDKDKDKKTTTATTTTANGDKKEKKTTRPYIRRRPLANATKGSSSSLSSSSSNNSNNNNKDENNTNNNNEREKVVKKPRTTKATTTTTKINKVKSEEDCENEWPEPCMFTKIDENLAGMCSDMENDKFADLMDIDDDDDIDEEDFKEGKNGTRKRKCSSQKKVEITRLRNREHARSTRQRKKYYIECLKQQIVNMLVQQQESLKSDQEANSTCSISSGNSDINNQNPLDEGIDKEQIWKMNLLKFFELRNTGNQNANEWENIIDDNTSLTLPKIKVQNHNCDNTQTYEIYSSSSSAAAKDSNTLHLVGVNDIMAETNEIQSIFNDIVKISKMKMKPEQSYESFSFDIDQNDILSSDTTIMTSWTLQVESSISKTLTILDGMLECKFNEENHKIEYINLIYDVMSLQRLIQICNVINVQQQQPSLIEIENENSNSSNLNNNTRSRTAIGRRLVGVNPKKLLNNENNENNENITAVHSNKSTTRRPLDFEPPMDRNYNSSDNEIERMPFKSMHPGQRTFNNVNW